MEDSVRISPIDALGADRSFEQQIKLPMSLKLLGWAEVIAGGVYGVVVWHWAKFAIEETTLKTYAVLAGAVMITAGIGLRMLRRWGWWLSAMLSFLTFLLAIRFLGLSITQVIRISPVPAWLLLGGSMVSILFLYSNFALELLASGPKQFRRSAFRFSPLLVALVVTALSILRR